MTSALLIALGFLAALNLTRTLVDQLARWRHWRVGYWGDLLCIWQRVGEACLHCRTDYRYVLGHPIRYTGETRETARAIIPLCQRCWLETPEPGRLQAAAVILNQWRQAGVYDTDGSFNKTAWDDHRLEIYSAIKGGL